MKDIRLQFCRALNAVRYIIDGSIGPSRPLSPLNHGSRLDGGAD